MKHDGLLRNALWGAYAVLVAFALYDAWSAQTLSLDVPLGALKPVVWLAWLVFLGYSVWCSTRENLLRSLGAILKFHWGRQVGIDLYLGLSLALLIIFLDGGALALALWLLPVLVYGNLAVLPYLAIHFDSIVGRFVG